MQNGQQQTQAPQGDIALDKQQQANHSLSADLAMGWRPKLKVIGPIPLNFDNDFIDKAIKDLLKSEASIYSVVYLGPRPQNTFKMHEILKKRYKYKYQHLFSVEYGHLKAFFHKFYSQFEPKMKTPFLGMNPMYKSHKIIFDSCFQSGNLDSAVKVNQNQYDLILRIDSNTAGHIMWYYFRATNNEKTNQTVKFNIINLRRNKSCYQRGMKPFIRRRKKTETVQNSDEGWSSWEQGGKNVQVDQQKIRFAKQTFVFEHGMVGIEEPPMLFRRLTFEVEFEPFEEVQFAYCVPYTYTDLTNDLKILKQTIVDQNVKNIFYDVDMNNESLSGLEIPVLKITQKEDEKYDEEKEKNKFCVYIIGRQHPGESNGSWTVKGMLQQLVKNTPEMAFLRKYIVFKIIPMLNVDGVVMGNFRTSLYGKDLNRLFKKQQLFLIPEVQMCKDIFNELLKIHKNKIMIFLDIHGHSARRNAFCYGPGILDANAFSDVRQFAKIIASRTQIFRYHSCSFRIDNDKKTTARACFSKSVGLGYTIESSNWSFYSKSLAKMVNFTKNQWEEIGLHLIESLHEYAEYKIMKNLQKKNKKNKNQGKAEKKNQPEINEKQSPRKTEKNQISSTKDSILRKTSHHRSSLSRTKTMKSETLQNNSENEYDIASKKQINKAMNQIEQAQNESDKMSDQGMDSDSEGEDMDKNKFEKYMNGAKKMMIEFEKVYLGDEYEKKGKTAAKLKNEAKKLLKQNSSKNIKKNSQILACLRKKEPNPQSVENPNKMIDIAGKIKLQPRKTSNNNTFTLNSKLIQYEPPQLDQDPRELIHLSQKSSYQKVVLPKIQESYQLKRRENYGEKVSPSRIEEWSQSNETPQLMMVNDDRYGNRDDEESFYAVRQRIRQKSITGNQNKSLHHLVQNSISQKKAPFNTVQSRHFIDDSQSSSSMNPDSDQESLEEEPQGKVQKWKYRQDQRRYSGLSKNYEQEGEISSIRQIKQNLRYNILHSKFQNQPDEPKNEVLLYIQSHIGREEAESKMMESPGKNIRFSMKADAMNQTPTRTSGIIKNARQFSQMRKKQLLQKLSDPVSLGYGNSRNQIISSQDLGGNKDKKNLVSFQFHNINYRRNEAMSQENTQANKHHQKIQQIILNNLQLMKGNPSKNNVRSKRQKMKEPYMAEGQNQKFSIDAITIGKIIPSKQSPDQPSFNKKTSVNAALNQVPPQIIKLVQSNANQQQEISSASVILPRNNVQQLEQLKTLESENLKKSQKPEEISSIKRAKGSASKNYSERQPNKEFDMLKEEEQINRKVMKFGESLPKISNERNSKAKSPHQYSKTKINLHINFEKQQRQSPRKTQKPLVNSMSPETDYKNIKLICINEKIPNEMDDERMQKEVKKYGEVRYSDDNRQNNKERLLSRLKELEREDKEKFGQQNLGSNGKLVEKGKNQQQSFKKYGVPREKQEQIKSKELFYFDNVQGARMKTNESQGNKEKTVQKETQIFVLPQGFNKSSYMK